MHRIKHQVAPVDRLNVRGRAVASALDHPLCRRHRRRQRRHRRRQRHGQRRRHGRRYGLRSRQRRAAADLALGGMPRRRKGKLVHREVGDLVERRLGMQVALGRCRSLHRGVSSRLGRRSLGCCLGCCSLGGCIGCSPLRLRLLCRTLPRLVTLSLCQCCFRELRLQPRSLVRRRSGSFVCRHPLHLRRLRRCHHLLLL